MVKDKKNKGGHWADTVPEFAKPFIESTFSGFMPELAETILGYGVEVTVIPEVLAAKLFELVDAARKVEIEVPIFGRVSGRAFGIKPSWLAVPAILTFKTLLTAWAEKNPNTRVQLIRFFGFLDPSGVIARAAATNGVSAFEGLVEALGTAMARHVTEWSNLEEKAAQTAIRPYLDRWDQWRGRVAGRVGTIAPAAGSSPASPTTITTTPAAAGGAKNVSILRLITVERASGDAVRKDVADRAGTKYNELQMTRPEIAVPLGQSKYYGAPPLLNAEEIMAVLVSCDNSVACVVDPDTGLMMTPLEAVLGPMIEDAQKAAQAPVAAPPAAGEIELFGVRIKRPQIPSPESVAESAKEYAKEQEVARAKNDAAEEAAKQQPGAAKEWFDKKGWADRIRKLKPW